ncbi:MAG: hypothetical protein ACXWBM_10380, partial [Chthoniobacterales bacterium]
RTKPEMALGCERFYLALRGVVRPDDLPQGWGLLEYHDRRVNTLVKPARQSLRTPEGFMNEMNLLLASLRRVEVRIEPQTITDFLKWKNRMAEYNGGVTPEGIVTPEQEPNSYLCAD